MYEAHFGLNKPLFQTGIAQESAVFFAARHQQIAASVKLALTTSDSAVVLTGPAGVGKTALMAAALRATSTKLALGWITVAPANAAELLELLLAEFGFSAHRVGRVERMQMWRQFLNEMSATSSRVYVIAERAEDLGADVLRALDSLTAADPNGSLGANLVLLGQPALLEVLKAPTLASLCQRIRLRQQLAPLALDELRAYLDHHAKAAGGSLDRLFARDTLAALHDITGGIPRLVNSVAETALTLAATRKNPTVTPPVLREVAQMFGIAPAPANPAEPPPEPAPATLIAPAVSVAPPANAGPAQPAPVAAQPAPVATQPPLATRPAPLAQPGALTSRPAPFVAQQNAPAARAAMSPPQGMVHTPAQVATQAATTSAPPAAATAARPTRVAPAPSSDPSPSIIARRPVFASAAAGAPAPALQTPIAPASASVGPVAGQPAPVAPASASVPAATAQPRAATSERQLMSDEEIDSFAATLTDSPDVPMLDFPVLTDAVEPARQRPRTETAYAKPPAPRAAAPEAAKPATPLPRVVAAATAPPAARAVKPPQPAAKPAPAASEDADVLRQTQTMRAIAVAKSIDDISSSMAETLFGDADLEKLSSAFEASVGTEDDAPAATPAPASPGPAPVAAANVPPQPPSAKPAPPTPAARPAQQMPAAKPAQQMPAAKPPPLPADDDPFDFLGLGRDAPLELIDEPVGSQQRKEAARNR